MTFAHSMRFIFSFILILLVFFLISGKYEGMTWDVASLYGLVLLLPALLILSFLGRKYKAPFLIHGKGLIFVFVLAFFTNCCCNHFLLIYYPSFMLHNMLMMLMIPAAFSAALILLLWSFLRSWALLIILPFLFIEYGQSIIFLLYGSSINSLVIAETLESSGIDAAGYLSLGNIAFASCLIFILSGIGYGLHRLLRKERSLSLAQNAIFFIIISCIFTAFPHPVSYKREMWPVSEIIRLNESYQEAVHHNISTINYAKKLKSPALSESSLSTLKGDEGLVFVLHIGESLLANRMSINGYKRDTTPHLKKMQRLINFPRCVASAIDTSQAQITMLTDARRNVDEPEAGMGASTGSVLDLFAKHGFIQYSFLGQKVSEKIKYDLVGRLLTSRVTQRFNARLSPWSALPQINSVLDDSGKKNLLLYVNNEGSHVPFQNYDQDNPPFTPVAKNFTFPDRQAEKVQNAYDCTVHYTDEFIHRLVSKLKGRPFVYVFVSDHGEALGENGMWGRAAFGSGRVLYHKSSACHIGMFIITSPEFESLHPHFAKALAGLQKNADIIVGHEHLFHSLLGIFGIKTPFYQERFDLTSPKVEAYSGPMPDYIKEAIKP